MTLPILGSGKEISPAAPHSLQEAHRHAASEGQDHHSLAPAFNSFHVAGQENEMFNLCGTQVQGNHGSNHAKWGSD